MLYPFPCGLANLLIVADFRPTRSYALHLPHYIYTLCTRTSNRHGHGAGVSSLSAIPTTSNTICSRILSLLEYFFQQLVEPLRVLVAYTVPSLLPTLILCFRHVTLQVLAFRVRNESILGSAENQHFRHGCRDFRKSVWCHAMSQSCCHLPDDTHGCLWFGNFRPATANL